MNRNNSALIMLGVSHLCVLAALGLTYDELPQRVASHFNAAGVPDGWMSRSSHLWTISALAFGGSALLLGVFYCVRFLPGASINLPRREYWLAPERREETFQSLFRAGIWLASFEALFVLGVHLLVVAANSSEPARLSSGVWLLGGFFLAIIAGWVFALIRRFNQVA